MRSMLIKCPSCMIGKATLEDFPKARQVKVKPLHQINVDSFPSSVPSIEGYNHAVVFVDKCNGYRWIYGMKTKDQMINVVKRWCSDIADSRTTHVCLRGTHCWTRRLPPGGCERSGRTVSVRSVPGPAAPCPY